MEIFKGKRCMVWSFMGNARMYEALRDYGDRLDTVGIFTFEVDITGTITETGTSISTMLTYINKWPHIKWLLTIMNHGTASVFTALRNNTNGAKTKFLSEIVRIMQKYKWCSGVDIDLERGGEYENRDAANALFRDIYNTVKGYDSKKMVNICLPGMTSVNGSVGGENWCVYADLNAYCDTAAIMSYGMAWAGSAPGPVSPRSWLEGIYNYAVQSMNPDKIFMGLPAYGWNWQIYDTPTNLGKTYRGTSHTYYAAKNWMNGEYNFTGDKPPQPFIPFFAYWDDYDKVPWMLPHVYDYMDGHSFKEHSGGLVAETYNRRRYMTCYSKQQKVDFGLIYIDRGGIPDEYTGNVIIGNNYIAVGTDGTAVYIFDISVAKNYDIAIRICYPFWDKNALDISLDGFTYSFSEERLWWPYWRSRCWLTLEKQIFLSEGTHTIEVVGGAYGTQFYGFRICDSFSEMPTTGKASFTLSPRNFKDVYGNMATPDRGFKLTTEVLRRKPDSALIWYEDFRDENALPSTYWTKMSGDWQVWHDLYDVSNRPYSQLEGSGQIAWQYDNFKDIHLRARIAFPMNGTGRAGVFCGDIYCCINIDSQCVELYKGDEIIGSYNSTYARTPDSDIRLNPNMYTIEMRIRGNSVRVYSGTSGILRFTADAVSDGGSAGLRSDGEIKCELIRLGDAWTYEPYEAFDVLMPDGSTKQYGRLARNGVTWDSEFQVFTLTADVEESATRSEDISMDYDFFHSDLLQISCGENYTAEIIPQDINVWVSRLFLGDADGFSILYYQDVDSIVYWSNEAAYRWGLNGIAIWSLGQEDLRLWRALPKQTST